VKRVWVEAIDKLTQRYASPIRKIVGTN